MSASDHSDKKAVPKKGVKKSGKPVKAYVKLQVPAGQAAPGQALGPALGQHGLNMAEFCKAFNEATKDQTPGVPIPVIIAAYADRTFTFTTKTPPASYLLRQAAKQDKGAKEPGREVKATVSRSKVRAIAEQKMEDLNAYDLDQAEKIIAGSARSMGFEVAD